MSDHKAEAAYWEAQEQQARAAMSPAELLEYRRHNHEIGDCPHCGKADVEMQAEVQPDMVGSMVLAHYACCPDAPAHVLHADGPDAAR